MDIENLHATKITVLPTNGTQPSWRLQNLLFTIKKRFCNTIAAVQQTQKSTKLPIREMKYSTFKVFLPCLGSESQSSIRQGP